MQRAKHGIAARQAVSYFFMLTPPYFLSFSISRAYAAG